MVCKGSGNQNFGIDMRKIILFTLLLSAEYAIGQSTSLNENMNTNCITGHNGPLDWVTYNPISTPDPQGKWKCDPTYGRDGSPGVSCTGYYGSPGTFHLDTSVLVSPALDLSHYETIYVNFDTKTTNINLGAKLEFLISSDSTMNADTGVHDTAAVYNKTTSLMPLFGSGDESGWVTHQADLTPYKHVVPLYLGFRYISANGTVGSRWYLDNIMTTIVPNKISDVKGLNINKVNASISDGSLHISIAGNLQPDNYGLQLFDLNGRKLFTDRLVISAANRDYYFHGINVTPGIYVLSMSNAGDFATMRVVAW